MLNEYDVVTVVRIDQKDRPYTGTESACRPPQVGDVGTVVHIYDPGNATAPVVVEAVAPNGYTIWLADFFPYELKLKS